MRRFLIAVAILVLAALPTTGAVAGTDVGGRGNTITGSDSNQGGSSTSGGTVGSIPPGMMAVQVPSVLGGGQYCLVTILIPVGTVLPPYNPISTTMTQVPCPANATPPPPTASQIAQAWVDSAHLPSPTLNVAPGYAVTGLTAYLEITAHSPWTATFSDPIRNDTITASCSYTSFDIDWGDGDHTAATGTGGPYPSGDVTHVYENASTATALSVTEHWSCSWSDQVGDSGTIAGLSSVGTLPLEVREIQTPTA